MNILIKLINDVKATLALIKAKTDTITTSVITQAQANNLDATISSRQANAGFTTTHSSRIDTAISTRATNDGVWSAPNRSLTTVKAGTTVRLSNYTEISVPTVGSVKTHSYKFRIPYSGSYNISLEYRPDGGAQNVTFEIFLNGANVTSTSHAINIIQTWFPANFSNVSFCGSGFVEVRITRSNTSASLLLRNFKVMYDFDTEITPTFL